MHYIISLQFQMHFISSACNSDIYRVVGSKNRHLQQRRPFVCHTL